MPLATRLLLLPLAALVLLAGCDTNDPSAPLDEVEGVYAIAELRFEPTAGGIADADVAARLDSNYDSSVEIFGSGDVLLRYKFADQGSRLVNGIATATRTSVRVTGETPDDVTRMAELLLPSPFQLSRSEDDEDLTGPSGGVATTANLEAFDPDAYAGLTSVPGRLFIRLERD